MIDCIFCKVAKGEVPSYKLYEDNGYLAFLDIRPHSKGQALVIPKMHFESYVFDLPEREYSHALLLARRVGKALDKALGSERTFLVAEGMEVAHAHFRLHPSYGGKALHHLLEDPVLNRSDADLENVAATVRTALEKGR